MASPAEIHGLAASDLDLVELAEFPEQIVEQTELRPLMVPFNRARMRHIAMAEHDEGRPQRRGSLDRPLAPRVHAGPHTLLRSIRQDSLEGAPEAAPGSDEAGYLLDGATAATVPSLEFAAAPAGPAADDEGVSVTGLSTACPSEISTGGAITDQDITDEVASGFGASSGSTHIASPGGRPGSDRPHALRARHFHVFDEAVVLPSLGQNVSARVAASSRAAGSLSAARSSRSPRRTSSDLYSGG